MAGAAFRARNTGPMFGQCPDSRIRRRKSEKGLEDRRDEFEEDALEVRRSGRVKDLAASPSEKNGGKRESDGREKGEDMRERRRGLGFGSAALRLAHGEHFPLREEGSVLLGVPATT